MTVPEERHPRSQLLLLLFVDVTLYIQTKQRFVVSKMVFTIYILDFFYFIVLPSILPPTPHVLLKRILASNGPLESTQTYLQHKPRPE